MKKLLHFADGVWVNQQEEYTNGIEIFKHMPKNKNEFMVLVVREVSCNSIHFIDLKLVFK